MSECCPDCDAPAKFTIGDPVEVVLCPGETNPFAREIVGKRGIVVTERDCDIYEVQLDGRAEASYLVEKQLKGVT